jgi:hypothetical protein
MFNSSCLLNRQHFVKISMFGYTCLSLKLLFVSHNAVSFMSSSVPHLGYKRHNIYIYIYIYIYIRYVFRLLWCRIWSLRHMITRAQVHGIFCIEQQHLNRVSLDLCICVLSIYSVKCDDLF